MSEVKPTGVIISCVAFTHPHLANPPTVWMSAVGLLFPDIYSRATTMGAV